MKKPTIYPEIYVEGKFLHRSDIVRKVIRTDKNVFLVTFNNPVLGEVTGIVEMLFKKNLIWLKCSFPHEMQTEEEIERTKARIEMLTLLRGDEKQNELDN